MTGLSENTFLARGAGNDEAGVRVFALPGDASRQIPDEALSVTAQLLANLEVDSVIELFASELERRVGMDSFLYQRDETGFIYSSGAPARHALTYRLVVDDFALGEFTVTRRGRFSVEEIARVEIQICGLVLALRNAWRYHEALERRAA
jgi:hypothetical protein